MPRKKAQKPSTWRDLNSSDGRKRRKIPLSLRAKLRVAWIWLRATLGIAALLALGYGAYYAYENIFFEEIFGVKSGEIKRIEFKTDGNITAKWLNEYLKIPARQKLSDISIFAVKAKLESLSQVESAAVERSYPDALKITLTELKPFMKFFTEISGKPRMFIMTPDGRFFEPACIQPEMIDAMPKIEGIKPDFDGSLPKKYDSAGKVAKFLALAYSEIPAEAQTWKLIDVSNLESRTLPLLKVVTDSGIEIIFAPRSPTPA